ncbi:MAG: hypothetical protein QOI05_3957 [Bradyrhizobium sp.]|nr:hypothetical protein [Bradyrhizobium sp.]
MTNRVGNTSTAILAGALASVTLVVATNGAALAADTCLSGPKGTAPKGSHWYYRIDHATKRNCWYVRAEGEKPVASQNSPLSQTSPQAETPLQPSVADARAEANPADIGQPNAGAAEPAPPAAANNGQGAPAADSGQSPVSSRWLDRADADTITGATPKPDDSGASLNPTAPVAAVQLAAANARPAAPSVSTLFLVIVGALALAALFAGVIYRFGSARRDDRQDFDRDQRAPWDAVDVGATVRSPPLATETPTPQTGPARERHEAAIPDEIVQLLSRLSKEAPA